MMKTGTIEMRIVWCRHAQRHTLHKVINAPILLNCDQGEYNRQCEIGETKVRLSASVERQTSSAYTVYLRVGREEFRYAHNY